MKQKPQSPEDILKKNSQQYENRMIRQRILDHEVSKIKKMTLRQMLQKQKKQQDILPPSPTLRHAQQNLQKRLRQAGFQDDLQTISEKQLELFQQAQKKNKIIRRQMRQAPIYSQIKRGKLGADNILIVFAVIGSLLLPFIIYERFRNNRSTIVKNRGINPRVIENLDEDSPISLDAVSQQSIMYENPDRVKQIQKKKEIAQSISKMQKELYL